jgi:hypothetical protein
MAQIEDRHRQIAKQVVTSPPDQAGQIALAALALADAEQKGRARARGGIRVLRVLEYTYPDAESMTKDMAHWDVQGTMRVPGGPTVRSVALPAEVLS